MRYYLKADEDPRGMVLRPVPNGNSKDGILSDACFDLVVETGKSFKGASWEHLQTLAKSPGYIDAD